MALVGDSVHLGRCTYFGHGSNCLVGDQVPALLDERVKSGRSADDTRKDSAGKFFVCKVLSFVRNNHGFCRGRFASGAKAFSFLASSEYARKCVAWSCFGDPQWPTSANCSQNFTGAFLRSRARGRCVRRTLSEVVKGLM